MEIQFTVIFYRSVESIFYANQSNIFSSLWLKHRHDLMKKILRTELLHDTKMIWVFSLLTVSYCI